MSDIENGVTVPTRHSPEQPIVIITTPAEYDAVRRVADRLVNGEPGSVDALTLQAFSAAIEAYEARHRAAVASLAGDRQS